MSSLLARLQALVGRPASLPLAPSADQAEWLPRRRFFRHTSRTRGTIRLGRRIEEGAGHDRWVWTAWTNIRIVDIGLGGMLAHPLLVSPHERDVGARFEALVHGIVLHGAIVGVSKGGLHCRFDTPLKTVTPFVG